MNEEFETTEETIENKTTYNFGWGDVPAHRHINDYYPDGTFGYGGWVSDDCEIDKEVWISEDSVVYNSGHYVTPYADGSVKIRGKTTINNSNICDCYIRNSSIDNSRISTSVEIYDSKVDDSHIFKNSRVRNSGIYSSEIENSKIEKSGVTSSKIRDSKLEESKINNSKVSYKSNINFSKIEKDSEIVGVELKNIHIEKVKISNPKQIISVNGLYAFIGDNDKEIRIKLDWFCGNIEEFKKYVFKNSGINNYKKEYCLYFEMLERYFKIWGYLPDNYVVGKYNDNDILNKKENESV